MRGHMELTREQIGQLIDEWDEIREEALIILRDRPKTDWRYNDAKTRLINANMALDSLRYDYAVKAPEDV